MVEITVLSGKGGTGKTSITAAFASVAKDIVLCDNDVDAADLHLILTPEIIQENVFAAGWQAHINNQLCVDCGKCAELCRFGAIAKVDETYQVNSFKCEGCRLCEHECPVKAITSKQSINNKWFVSNTRYGKMVHAKMGAGEENSGKLVSLIRSKSKAIAEKEFVDIILNDGPPGIGCTAISSLTGTDKVLIVIEPTRSGWHDAARLIQLVHKFGINCYAIINKFDLNKKVCTHIIEALNELKIDLLGKISFNEDFVRAALKQQSIIEYAPKSKNSILIQNIWAQLVAK
ncbi:MAG: ATP-binding protein [Hyphomicrobiales bacterium]